LTRLSIQDLKFSRRLPLPPSSGFYLFVVYLTTLSVAQTYSVELPGVMMMEAGCLSETLKINSTLSRLTAPKHIHCRTSDLFPAFLVL
jgi:hypothetical protein